MWLFALLWDAFWELISALVIALVAADITRRISQIDASLQVIDRELADLITVVN